MKRHSAARAAVHLVCLMLAAAPALAAPPATAHEVAAAKTASCPTTTARSDIDGDGKRDTISVTQTRGGDSPQWRLCVKTATGRVSTIVHSPDFWVGSGPVFAGAAGLDGTPGNEIVLRSGTGAHSHLSRVYAWRNGRLAVQNEPVQRQPDWYVDWAASVVMGNRFFTSHGVRYLVATYAERSPIGSAPFVGQATTFRWAKNQWVRVSTNRVSIPHASPLVEKTYGWNGVALPKD